MIMIVSDMRKHLCMFFFSYVQLPWCRPTENKELNLSRLGLGQGVMMEEERERDLCLFVKNPGF